MKTLIRKYLIYAVLGVAFLVGVLGSVSEGFQLLWIPRDEAGLLVMGQVKKREGSLRRRFVNDVIWFSAHEGDRIFLGDNLETGKDTAVEIEITQFAKGSLRINSESLVKMRVMMSKPVIVLSRGEVDVSGEEADNMFVNSGLKTERIKIRKGTMTKIRRTDDGDLEVKVFRTDIKNEQGQAEIGQSKDVWVSGRDSNVMEGQEWFPRPLQYPYPADQTAFLVMEGSGKVALFPKEECDTVCRLHVAQIGGAEVISKEFKMGDPVFGVIPYSEGMTGDYRWTLSDGGNSISGVFFFRTYSAPEMKKQMQLRHPIEVLTGL